MPFSPLDALMQVVAPARALEPPPRNDGPGAFAPALEQAYQAESPRPPGPPAAPPVEEKPKAADPSASGEKRDSDRPTNDLAAKPEPADGADGPAEAEEAKSGDDGDQDAAEISAEGAAAMGVIQDAKNVEQKVVADAGGMETNVVAAPEVDAKPSSEPAKNNAVPTGEETATDEGAGASEPSVGKSAPDLTTEVAVSAPNTRRRQSDDERQNRESSGDGNTSDHKANRQQAAEATDAVSIDGAEDATSEQPPAEQNTAEVSADADSDSRGAPSAKETSETADDVKRVASKNDAPPPPGDVAAAAPPTLGENSAASPADVAGPPPAAVVADSTTNAPEAAPRAPGAIDRMIGGHSLKASKESSEPNGMPTVDRARFVQRVEGAMKAAQQRDGKIQVRLSPPDLGSIKIELAVQNGVLSAKLEAETPAARNLLLDSLPALRERLAQQDIRVDKFDVDVRREGSSNGNGQPDERAANQSGERQPGRNRPAAVRAPGNATVSLRSSAATTSSAAGLDVRV
ncbi:MAG: flagellar hook-length control protein FliK [Planctomycetaceae bacterium]|nr:flagellar hook-length control protein FliK [Planctomycetaceae bacterium]